MKPIKVDVLAYWTELSLDPKLTALDRIVGAAIARRGRMDDAAKLWRSLGNWPRGVDVIEVSRSIGRLKRGGHLDFLDRQDNAKAA